MCIFICLLFLLGTDSGSIYIWNVPEGGLVDIVEEPVQCIAAHADKIYSIEV